MLYARAILLRNCGRFTHVRSDFGSLYHTHLFVTSEALYASLTRGTTWRHPDRFVDLEADAPKSTRDDYFFCDYDVAARPVWFTLGVFVDETLEPLRRERSVVDSNDFNVINEGYPGTGGGGRPFYVPTYGKIESVLPDHRLLTHALSPDPEELARFSVGQTYLLGKKRTMVQIIALSVVAAGQQLQGDYEFSYAQVKPDLMRRLAQYQILAATARYLVVRGMLNDEAFWHFEELEINGVPCPITFPARLLPDALEN